MSCTGDIEREMDPFFPFEEAVDVWARTFAALGIQYKGATMRLDLCDRTGKYSNGFCHWPQPAWRKVSTPLLHLHSIHWPAVALVVMMSTTHAAYNCTSGPAAYNCNSIDAVHICLSNSLRSICGERRGSHYVAIRH